MFLNDGSGKTLRERDILLDFCNRVRRTFLFQAYDPDTLRFLSAGPVYKVIVVRINKKDKSGKAGERKKSMYVSRVEGIRRRLNGLSPRRTNHL